MAVALRGAGAFTEHTSEASTDVPYPATVGAGDLLVLIGSLSILGTTGITNPSGWTQIYQSSPNAGANSPDTYMGIKYGTGSEGGTNETVTHTSGVDTAWQILAFSGVDQTTPQETTLSTVDQASSSTCTIPGVTITNTGAALVVASAINSNSRTSTPPTGFTETGDRTTGHTRSMGVSYLTGVTPGPTGDQVVTWSAAARSVGVMLSIRPAAANVTLTVTVGTATAAGTSTGFTAGTTLTANAGTSAAAGTSTSFTAGAALAATAGGSTAAGTSTTLTGAATFTTVAATATAAGSTVTYTAGSTFTTTAATGTAAGTSTTFTIAVALTATTGTATAAGASTVFTAAVIYTTTTGTGSAAGTSTAFSTGTAFTATTGTAAAAGTTVTYTAAATWSAATGTSAAAGTATGFTAAAAALISTVAGTAAAAGSTVGLTGAAQLTTTAGTAAAAGSATTFTAGAVFATTTGTATADGSTAALGATATLTTTAGDATADGASVDLTGASVFEAGTADATAQGQDADLTATASIDTVAGEAQAAGGIVDLVPTLPPLVQSPRASVVHNVHSATLVANTRTGVAVDNVTEGDLAPAWECVLTDGGQAFDPTGDTVEIKCWRNGTLLFNRSPDTTAADGTITMNWQAGDTDDPGPLKFKVVVTAPGVGRSTFPPKGFLITKVHPATP